MTNQSNWIVLGAILFIILISLQYSVNKIIVLLKEIKELLMQLRNHR